VSKVDAGIQQFLNSDTNHNLPLVKSPPFERTIPRNTGLISVLLWPPAPLAQEFKAVKPYPVTGQYSQAAFPDGPFNIAGFVAAATPFSAKSSRSRVGSRKRLEFKLKLVGRANPASQAKA